MLADPPKSIMHISTVHDCMCSIIAPHNKCSGIFIPRKLIHVSQVGMITTIISAIPRRAQPKITPYHTWIIIIIQPPHNTTTLIETMAIDPE
jgi:hypothetical protein